MSTDLPQAEAFTFGMEKVPATDKDSLTVAAYLTTDEEGSPTMLFFDQQEAGDYCELNEEPVALVRLTDAQSTLLAQAAEKDAEIDRLRADADHHRQLFNVSKLGHEQAFAKCQQLSDLLRRSLSQLGKWQRKYGEHNPAWLPPDGDVRLAEDIDTALSASRALAQQEAKS